MKGTGGPVASAMTSEAITSSVDEVSSSTNSTVTTLPGGSAIRSR